MKSSASELGLTPPSRCDLKEIIIYAYKRGRSFRISEKKTQILRILLKLTLQNVQCSLYRICGHNSFAQVLVAPEDKQDIHICFPMADQSIRHNLQILVLRVIIKQAHLSVDRWNLVQASLPLKIEKAVLAERKNETYSSLIVHKTPHLTRISNRKHRI